jgi:nicotinamidase-related amidase
MAIANKIERSAVLIMDYQPAILRLLQQAREPLVARAQNFLVKSREAGLKVIYANVSLRAGYPEVSERNNRATRFQGHPDHPAVDYLVWLHADLGTRSTTSGPYRPAGSRTPIPGSSGAPCSGKPWASSARPRRP